MKGQLSNLFTVANPRHICLTAAVLGTRFCVFVQDCFATFCRILSWFLSRLFQLWDVVFSVLVKRVALCERFARIITE